MLIKRFDSLSIKMTKSSNELNLNFNLSNYSQTLMQDHDSVSFLCCFSLFTLLLLRADILDHDTVSFLCCFSLFTLLLLRADILDHDTVSFLCCFSLFTLLLLRADILDHDTVSFLCCFSLFTLLLLMADILALYLFRFNFCSNSKSSNP